MSASMHPSDNTEVDIIICVHDARDHVQACLDSLTRHRDPRQSLIIVDDGSSLECQDDLTHFVRNEPRCILVRNDSAHGYTRAANQGLRLSNAEFVILLNSDTIVTQHWLDRLHECANSDPRIGIVGPISNAAGYQSVPEVFGETDTWSSNLFPPGWEADAVAELVATIAPHQLPRVPWVHGFCFGIKRPVIEAIGYLDEVAFPEGYAEEYDYCMRAADAGFALAIADHAYVYHAQSQSYSDERHRAALKRAGTTALIRKHGKQRVSESLTWLMEEPTLAMIRGEMSRYLRETSPPAGSAI